MRHHSTAELLVRYRMAVLPGRLPTKNGMSDYGGSLAEALTARGASRDGRESEIELKTSNCCDGRGTRRIIRRSRAPGGLIDLERMRLYSHGC